MGVGMTGAMVLTLAVVGGGCGGGEVPGGEDEPRKTPTAVTGSAEPEHTPSSEPTSDTEALLLARQVQLQEGGDGLGPHCRMDEKTPVEFEQVPGVWLHNLFSQTDYPGVVVLCLRGFDPETPIDVVVGAGDLREQTTVTPSADEPTAQSSLGYDEERPTTLFEDGGTLPVYSQGYGGEPIEGPEGVMVSEMWHFMPPPDVREVLAEEGSFTLAATQGDRSATTEVEVPVPAEQAHYDVGSGSGRLLAVLGYPAGTRVPIGLYRNDDDLGPDVALVKQIGSVTMPRSRVATMPLGAELLAGEPLGSYCVIPPVAEPAACTDLEKWPGFPGVVSPGERGASVVRWQDILIRARVISDVPENRDGFYGPATVAKVREYLELRGVSNPDGTGILGPGLYTMLTGAPAD